MNEGFYLILLGAYLMGIALVTPRHRQIYAGVVIVLGIIAFGLAHFLGVFHVK